MPAKRDSTPGVPSDPVAGHDLKRRVEALGAALAEGLSAALTSLPNRSTGPQKLAQQLGITAVTASRFLKALAQSDPIATLQWLPGPSPLRQLLAALRENGGAESDCLHAQELVAEFDELIRDEAGDRGTFKAILSAWLPGERREFEAQRRQAIFKASAELDGVSADLELHATILHPGGARRTAVVELECVLGIDRLRPDAVVRFRTHRGHCCSGAELPGDAARRGTDALAPARLDEFCTARPAPLESRSFDGIARHSLGPTGFGPHSKVDVVLVERFPDAFPAGAAAPDHAPTFLAIPALPVRLLVFDLLVHRDVFPGIEPVECAYVAASLGPAAAGDPLRELDRRASPEPLQRLGEGLRRLRLAEFPRYLALLERVLRDAGADPAEFRAYRVAVRYPLQTSQITLALAEADARPS